MPWRLPFSVALGHRSHKCSYQGPSSFLPPFCLPPTVPPLQLCTPDLIIVRTQSSPFVPISSPPQHVSGKDAALEWLICAFPLEGSCTFSFYLKKKKALSNYDFHCRTSEALSRLVTCPSPSGIRQLN